MRWVAPRNDPQKLQRRSVISDYRQPAREGSRQYRQVHHHQPRDRMPRVRIMAVTDHAPAQWTHRPPPSHATSPDGDPTCVGNPSAA